MARELSDIIKELNVVYNPLRDTARNSYNTEIPIVDSEMTAESAGLEQAKKDTFGEIENRANRRGMFFSGIPLKEQAQYTGREFLPAVASLKNRYASRKNQLFDAMMKTIAGYDAEESNRAMGIRSDELRQDEERRQFEARMAFEREQADAARRAAASSGGGGGGGSISIGGGGFGTRQTGGQVLGVQKTLRQTWQEEANRGDQNAQVALRYAGDDGRYDGPVSSQRELNILRSMGIMGNYYVTPPAPTSGRGLQVVGGSGTGGLQVMGSGSIPTSSGLSTGIRRL